MPLPWLEEGGVRGGEGESRSSLSLEAAVDGSVGKETGKTVPNGDVGCELTLVMSDTGDVGPE